MRVSFDGRKSTSAENEYDRCTGDADQRPHPQRGGDPGVVGDPPDLAQHLVEDELGGLAEVGGLAAPVDQRGPDDEDDRPADQEACGRGPQAARHAVGSELRPDPDRQHHHRGDEDETDAVRPEVLAFGESR